MDDLGELEQTLERLLSGGAVDVHEDGELLADLAGPHFEVRRQGSLGFLHLWSDQRNLVRRVLRVAENSPDGLLLEVQRFGTAKPGRLEIVRASPSRRPAQLSRQKFRARLGQLLAEQFPDETVDSLTTAQDLEHSFSGSYARGLMHQGRLAWAVLGASPEEDTATIDAALGFGLLWLSWAREHAGRRKVEGLRLLLPANSARLTAHRMQALGPKARIELYEWLLGEPRARRLDPSDAGNVATWLTPRRDAEEALAASEIWGRRIRALAPGSIDAVVPPGTREVAWRFLGLEFARWTTGEVCFGLGSERHVLTEAAWSALVSLVREFQQHRRAVPPDLNHPLYRGLAERWLEALVLSDPSRIDARLDPRQVYSQVPAFSAGDRGVIDLLGSTRDGRLAVIELKADEDLLLPLQAIDYWLRVRWHHREGDFSRYGYFHGVELRAADPLLYLVAPGLRFHPATQTLLDYFAPQVAVTRVGLNENWRGGLKVVFRQ